MASSSSAYTQAFKLDSNGRLDMLGSKFQEAQVGTRFIEGYLGPSTRMFEATMAMLCKCL